MVPYEIEERANKKWPPWGTEEVQVTQDMVEKRNMAGETGKGEVQYYRQSII